MHQRKFTVTDLLAQIKSRSVRVLEIAKQVIEEIEKTCHLNVFISNGRDTLLSNARVLDEKMDKGEVMPLHGLPIIVKDNIDTVDFKTTGGTPALAEHQPSTDAAVVQRLRDAGAMVVGKANLHELAFGITSNNKYYGPVRNPYDQNLIPGGSSGGTGAAVSANIVPAGLGTDTGGSVRIPAALCGVCGFRPTTGRYPHQGMILLSRTRDTVGIFAHTVEDIALIDKVIVRGNSINKIELGGLRLGIPRVPFYTGLEEEMVEVLDVVLEKLVAHGVELVERDMNDVFGLNEKVSLPVVLYETANELRGYLQRHNLALSFDELVEKVASPDVKQILGTLCKVGTIQEDTYKEALEIFRPQLQQTYANYFSDNEIDAVLYPTTPLTARPIGEDEYIQLNGRKLPTFSTYIRNCDPSANAGIPSLSIPAGLTKSGLPVGLSIDGPSGNDNSVLSIGAAIETALPPIDSPNL